MDIELLVFGIIIGIGGTVMLLVIYQTIKMNYEFMIIRKVRKHEEKFHAKELKERENPGGDN